jgi:hypothetical protein
MRRWFWIAGAVLMLLGFFACLPKNSPSPAETPFGTTQPPAGVPSSSGTGDSNRGGALLGSIYLLPENTQTLPDFAGLRPVGQVSTAVFDIPSRSFESGFPGISERFEWFAIDYRGNCRFAGGEYLFRLESDDGSRFYIDDQLVIDNDGVHAPLTREQKVNVSAGLRRVRLSYFQGPRTEIALRLVVRAGGKEELFRCRP